MQAVSTPISPCNKNCIMDPITNFCKGCFRTIDEIIRWSTSSEEEKILMMKKIERRKNRFNKYGQPSI